MPDIFTLTSNSLLSNLSANFSASSFFLNSFKSIPYLNFAFSSFSTLTLHFSFDSTLSIITLSFSSRIKNLQSTLKSTTFSLSIIPTLTIGIPSLFIDIPLSECFELLLSKLIFFIKSS